MLPGTEASVLFKTVDSEGAKYTKLVIEAGGKIKDTNGNQSTELLLQPPLVDGMAKTAIFTAGNIIPNTADGDIVFHAEGSNWAGTAVSTPSVTLIQEIPQPKIDSFTTYYIAPLGAPMPITWETTNAERVDLYVVSPGTNGHYARYNSYHEPDGGITITPTVLGLHNYKLVAHGVAGTEEAIKEVNSTVLPYGVVDYFRTSSTQINRNSSIILSWRTSDSNKTAEIHHTKPSGTTQRIVAERDSSSTDTKRLTLSELGEHEFQLTLAIPHNDPITRTLSVTVKNPTPVENCFSTPTRNVTWGFTADGGTANGSRWIMNLSSNNIAFNDGNQHYITTIKNETVSGDYGPVALKIGKLKVGNREIPLDKGSTTNHFRGLNAIADYVVEVEHTDLLLPHVVNIKVCHD